MHWLTAVKLDNCQSEKFQARFHPLCIQLKYMKLNWSFVSQKKHHTSTQAYKSKNKKGNSVQCYSFFETLLYLKSTLENTARLNNKATDDSLVDFDQQRKNDNSVVLFSYGEKMSII